MCRSWVVDGELPAATDQVTQSLFHARLVEAHALGAWLRENGFGAPDVRVEPLLELLLIDEHLRAPPPATGQDVECGHAELPVKFHWGLLG